MMYLVNTTCQFRNRLYEKGDTIDLPAEVEAPPYFDALEEAAPDADNTQPETVESVDEPVTNEAVAGKKGRKK